MNKKNRKNTTAGTIAMAIFLLGVVLEIAENNDELAAIGVTVFVIAVCVILIRAKKGKGGKSPLSPTAQKIKEKFEKQTTSAEESSAADAEYHYSEVNCEFSHDYMQRIEQLDSFLKNGIIGKEEYNILKEKYLRAEMEHEEY